MRFARRTAFTLVELLVVIVIIGLLLALLLPATQFAREAARRTGCQNNLKQLGLAMHLHHDSHQSFAAGWVGRDGQRNEISAGPGWGWGAQILPFLEQASLYDQLDFRRSCLDPANAMARQTSLPAFRCASDSGPNFWQLRSKSGVALAELPTANYVGNFGGSLIELCDALAGTGRQCNGEPYGGMLFHNSLVRLAEVTDGTSNTLLIGERLSRSTDNPAQAPTWVGAIWESEGGFTRVVSTARHVLGTSGRGSAVATEFSDFSSRHSGGAYFVFADGHVAMLSEQIDHLAFVDLATRGETYSDEALAASASDSENGGVAPGTDPPATLDGATVDFYRPGTPGCPFCNPR